VRLGLGIGIVTELAVANTPGEVELASVPLGHLFGTNIARVAFKRGAYLRQFVLAFAESLSPRLSAKGVAQAMQGEGTDFQL
jgi:LysR family cys regulon transcriptional activator